MAFIHFLKEQLADLDFSLQRETLQANSLGAYCSSSLVSCNTRKYHGLLVVQQPQIDDNRYVLLSSLDETILQGVKTIRLATHRYPEVYYPEGYYYLEDFSHEKFPTWIIRADDMLLKKEIILVDNDERVLIRYTVLESKLPFQMQFNPFVAFRNIHELSKSNLNANKKLENVANGIKLKMYSGFSDLYIQFSKKADFVHAPDWNYNNEYNQEHERGYEFHEDLYSPGYFTSSMKKGDEIVFSAGLSEISPRTLKTLVESQVKKHIPLKNFYDCLKNAAAQFIVQTNKKTEIMAGYHWFGQWGRDTFIALPGLTLSTGHPETCKAVLDAMLKNLKDGLFPNIGKGNNAAYNTADASLWFFWALQQYAINTGMQAIIWDEYGNRMKSVLDNYRKGTQHQIHMEENGLLFAGEQGLAVTWMDAIVDGKPVTPRIGFAVELNALWYNAIRFSLEVAELAGDDEFVNEWETMPLQIELSFKKTFWNEEKKYLADYVHGAHTNWQMRPNQLMAASLPYSPIGDEIKKSLLEIIKVNLLTPRGLRTLCRDDKHYKGSYQGNHRERDMAYHQGTVWPWLLGHFAEAWLRTHGESGMPYVQSLYENFAPAVLEYGIGTIAEIYDGDEPHHPKGAISQAWSVAELLRIRAMISEGYTKEDIKKNNQSNVLQTT